MYLPKRESYDSLIRDFRWEIPDRFNIGRAVADDWAAREPGWRSNITARMGTMRG